MSFTVMTPCGALEGGACRLPGVAAFRGIRYATAGRWEYPQPVTHWEGVYDASHYGACSWQPRAFYDEAQVPEKAFYYNEFRRDEHYAYSEDCLFLNIWTPQNAGPQAHLPVIVYIHGGGFTGGCGHEKHFDGPVWPLQGVIAVTVNYRLGPLGFACLPALTAEAGHTGNYGLFDQLAALQWVRANIAAFGGDPERITIMGQSAGAMSVQQICLTPLAKGLFTGAVMSSGGGVSAMLSAKPADQLYDFWLRVMQQARCPDLASLRALPVQKLFEAWQTVKSGDKNGAMAAAPVQDGVFIHKPGHEVLAAGEQLRIPYLVGTTSHDVMPPLLFKMGKSWCRTQADQGGPPAYMWFFDRRLPGDDNGAWHSSDLWYWFGTLANGWRPFTDKDRRLSAEMVGYLTNFAKTGDPNGGELPAWQPLCKGQSRVLRIGEDATHMGGVNMAKLTYTMMTNRAVGE